MIRIIFVIIIVIILQTMVFSTMCLNRAHNQACADVFNPLAMKTSCCKEMDQFVDRINACHKQTQSAVFSCDVSRCVTQQYGIVTNGKIDEGKVNKVLIELDKQDPNSKPLNDEIRKNCVNGQFMKYVTSDARCETMQFQVCAFVNYLNGCQKFERIPPQCEGLARSVATCKPVLHKYLTQHNSCKKNK